MGKGKVHPSPSPAAAAETADSVLMRLLPAAVLAMAAPLGAEGKEVLAYLVLASLRSPPPPATETVAARRIGEEEGKGKVGGSGRVAAVAHHAPELGCGCFGCYTAYWSRWDGSPERDRDAIHAAIEAFEDHLARNEVEEKQGKGRRRKKRGKDKEKGKSQADSAGQPPPPAAVIVPEKEETSTAAAAASPPLPVAGGEEAKEVEDEEEEGKTTAGGGGGGDGRRRGWGVLSWRGWGQLWGGH